MSSLRALNPTPTPPTADAATTPAINTPPLRPPVTSTLVTPPLPMPGRYTRAHAPLSRAAEEANWFTLPSAVRVYRQFLQLDTDHDGMLTPQELARFDEEQHSLTPAFCGRLFEVVHTYEGRLDYKGYLDLVVALQGLRPTTNSPDEAALRYFWRVLNLREKGAIGGDELLYFVRDVVRCLPPHNLPS